MTVLFLENMLFGTRKLVFTYIEVYCILCASYRLSFIRGSTVHVYVIYIYVPCYHVQ